MLGKFKHLDCIVSLSQCRNKVDDWLIVNLKSKYLSSCVHDDPRWFWTSPRGVFWSSQGAVCQASQGLGKPQGTTAKLATFVELRMDCQQEVWPQVPFIFIFDAKALVLLLAVIVVDSCGCYCCCCRFYSNCMESSESLLLQHVTAVVGVGLTLRSQGGCVALRWMAMFMETQGVVNNQQQ